MKINGEAIPDNMTHEQAADLFMSTAVGRSTGVSREDILARLQARFPTEAELATFIRSAKLQLEAMLAPIGDPPIWRHSEYTIDPIKATITCSTCGMTSHNRHDVENRYCGKCHKFHEATP